MNTVRLLLLFLSFSLFTSTTRHKYYISVTQIEHVKEKKSVQIIARVFLDDFENLLQKRYDESIVLADNEEQPGTNGCIEKYLNDKIKIKINGEETKMVFIGKEYELDVMKCYLEIEGVENIESFEISNAVLFDMFDDQQNIIKTKINSKQKSFILIPQNNKAVLNFN